MANAAMPFYTLGIQASLEDGHFPFFSKRIFLIRDGSINKMSHTICVGEILRKCLHHQNSN
jgi:hypothetical protein